MPDIPDGKLFQTECDNAKQKHLMNHECDIKTKTLKLRKKDLCVTTGNFYYRSIYLFRIIKYYKC